MLNQDLIIVERIKKPPYANKREVIYYGKPLETKEIHETLGLTLSSFDNFYYTILFIEKADSSISISKKLLEFETLKYQDRITIPMNSEVTGLLMKFLT